MRESYKRFVKTCICFISWSWILTPKRLVSFRDWQIRLQRFTNPDLRVLSLKIRFVDSFHRLIFKRFDLFSRIQQILMNLDKSFLHRRTLNKPKSIWILGFGFTNQYCFQKICFMDSFCRPFFERYVLWIRFVDLFSKDLFCGFVLWKQKYQITRFVSFWKDSYTNPASLIIILGDVNKAFGAKRVLKTFFPVIKGIADIFGFQLFHIEKKVGADRRGRVGGSWFISTLSWWRLLSNLCYWPSLNNGHLPTTPSLIPAKLNLISILIENPPKSGHLCTTATILGLQGWPLLVCLTVLSIFTISRSRSWLLGLFDSFKK